MKILKLVFISIFSILLLAGCWYVYQNFSAIASLLYPISESELDTLQAGATTRSSTSTQVLGTTTEVTLSYDKLYALINGYRREHKLSTLTAHRALELSAARKLRDMQENHYWMHTDPQGRDSWYLIEESGYHYEKAGENLSFGYTTEWSIFTEWQKSPEHNAQMLEAEYEHMGLAADCTSYAQASKKTCVVVLHLAKQKL